LAIPFVIHRRLGLLADKFFQKEINQGAISICYFRLGGQRVFDNLLRQLEVRGRFGY